jgi:hypothetical protein
MTEQEPEENGDDEPYEETEPSILEEKRANERTSRRIAFGEGF